jgi:hypothetical protein
MRKLSNITVMSLSLMSLAFASTSIYATCVNCHQPKAENFKVATWQESSPQRNDGQGEQHQAKQDYFGCAVACHN